jgi:hypothetical protein
MKFLTYQPPYFDAKSVRVLDKSYVFFINLDATYGVPGNLHPTKFMIATKDLAYVCMISGISLEKYFILGHLEIYKDTDGYSMMFQMEIKILVEKYDSFGAEEFD